LSVHDDDECFSKKLALLVLAGIKTGLQQVGNR
jgi:hypothetical protein